MAIVATEPKRPFGRQWSARYAAVLALCMLALLMPGLALYGIATALRQPSHALDWLSGSGRITRVAPDSVAERAGIQPGDIVLAINGVPRVQAGSLLTALRPGQTFELTLQRGTALRRVELSFTQISLEDLCYRLIPLVVGLLLALFGLLLWLFKPFDPIVALFMVLNQLAAAVLVVGQLGLLRYWPGRWFDLCLCLGAAALVHFHLVFPTPRRLRARPLVLGALYAAALLCNLSAWPFWEAVPPPLGPLGYLLSGRQAFVLAVLVTFALLLHAYLTLDSALERRCVRIVAAGTLFGLAPLLLLALLPELLLGQPLIPFQISFLGMLCIPLAYLVAIRQHNLLQIDRILSRCVTHMLLVLLIIGVYGLLTFGVLRLLSPTLIAQPVIWGSITLLIALLFSRLRDLLQQFVDRAFYGGWYDYQSLIGELSQALNGVTSTEVLADLLELRLGRRLRVRGMALLMSTDQQDLRPVRAQGWPGLLASLPLDGALARHLASRPAPHTSSELSAALAAAPLANPERAWLGQPDLGLWVPLIHRQRLQGLLLLGHRSGNEPFDQDDRLLLETLANQTSTAIANVQLIHALSQRAEKIDQLYSQLVQSRESERKRLARELHDQTIQELINIHYYLSDAPPPGAQSRSPAALREQVQRAIGQLREICTDLRPVALGDLSVDLILQGYVDECVSRHAMPIRMQVQDMDGDLEHVSEDVSLCLFRVLQETLANVRRHAQASEVLVSLVCEDGQIVLEVSDNGCGFDCPPHMGVLVRAKHFGLAGMQERAALLGGLLTIESAPGQGTLVRTRLPLLPLAATAPPDQP